ncbi:acyl-CoA/acyl-ACP dehydrogenase [Paracoccaceae bacterium]|nr:acyl-CoA/acyl-ACP dehydrogenase [Paracoccaceae bacterium]
MNISTPVHKKNTIEFLTEDAEIVTRSQVVSRQLDRFLGHLKVLVKSRFCESNDDNKHQSKLHGLAWTATYVEALKQMSIWAEQLCKRGTFGKAERIILILSFNEYLNQIFGGIMMSQNEVIRPADLDHKKEALEKLNCGEVFFFKDEVDVDHLRSELIGLIIQNESTSFIGNDGLGQDQNIIRREFNKFSKEKIEPFAHEWHLKDELIPLNVIDELANLGVFGLTIPEEFGGTGLDKITMCVVSEELSRGYIGVGSLATRTDIASELILCGGSKEQKEYWLPKISSGEIMPTAVFTEPNTGSDLGSLQTRAVLTGEEYSITGNKTWITHASRANLMTLLARSDRNKGGYKGLSMFLAPKSPGKDNVDFPDKGIKGGEIEVLGYRGMKEYEISFDDFRVDKKNLLGEEEGKGFTQLMETFESARIQTAARAIGVAKNAFDLGLKYANERTQFGGKIVNFPRVRDKLVNMAVEIMVAKQLTYFSARAKDDGKRCDLEAGMAKLLAARIAWTAADNSLQIHGGNGFALEYPISRVLCDARILNIFEGAAEIQAQVIAKRILS